MVVCRAWLGSLVLLSAGAALCWASDADAEPERPSPDTFEYTEPTEKNYLRAVLELEALTTVSVVWLAATVKRTVYLRDHGRLSFISADGRRCDARAMLELDHIEPWAALGGAGSDNIRLRCRAHSQWHARQHFGARHIAAKIAARREVGPWAPR